MRPFCCSPASRFDVMPCVYSLSFRSSTLSTTCTYVGERDCRSAGDKRKCSEAAAAADTGNSTAHSSWGASSRLERGFEHVGSENVLGNVPEDDCLSTSEQCSGRSPGAGTQALSTRAEPSLAPDHSRNAEGTNPQLVSAEDVQPVVSGQESSQPSMGTPQPSPQPCQPPLDSSRPPTPGSRARALSGPLPPTGGSMEAMGTGGVPLHRSHEATVRRLDAAIEQFGKEKQGYDLVGVAQAMVGFEKMVIEVRAFAFLWVSLKSCCPSVLRSFVVSHTKHGKQPNISTSMYMCLVSYFQECCIAVQEQLPVACSTFFRRS